MVLAKGQFVNPIAREFVALVEAGKAAVRGDVKRILRNHRAASADRRSVINGFGIGVGSGNSDAMGNTLAQTNRSGVIHGIGGRRFVDKRLHTGDGDGALALTLSLFRPVV